jgi:hypothetical protein
VGGFYENNKKHLGNTTLEVYNVKKNKWFLVNAIRGVAVEPGVE